MWCGVHYYPRIFLKLHICPSTSYSNLHFEPHCPQNGTENGANSVLEGSQRSTVQWRFLIHKTRVYLNFPRQIKFYLGTL